MRKLLGYFARGMVMLAPLAVTVAVLFAPARLAGGREIASLAGAAIAAAAVFAGSSGLGS